jgi:hypothetical protein
MRPITKALNWSVAMWLAVSLLAGCKPNNTPPTPLPVQQIPAEMNKAFTRAKPETKQIVDKMLAALESKDYPAAYQFGQYISGTPGITKGQLFVTARAMLEINSLLKEASTKGDQRASGFIDYQKHTR